ncbi:MULTISPECIES: hypothetical protein [unclassified Pedobacter]|uniref:hypothetical protein n=1 Tax=unclassified Pedobacter TaxID=2628915 RepID=UPI00142148AC|nr:MULTISPECIES: hypothetical protein [unclassified Pedobacter]NII83304.1 type II secretory pathway component PulC [Pedobacter sp. SG908]NMN37174.1 type II secretory pathway component PulC [Pedobacter sp. SG918]
MKSKKTTYILICCVAGVWGIIFYRVFAGLAAEDNIPVNSKTIKEPYFNMTDHANDQVTLEMGYTDPFALANSAPEPIVKSAVPVLPSMPVPIKPQVNWTGIIYSGQIYNRTEKKHVAIISVNGKEVMLSEGERANGLKFIKRVGDSIKVEYQNATKFLSIKQ